MSRALMLVTHRTLKAMDGHGNFVAGKTFD